MEEPNEPYPDSPGGSDNLVRYRIGLGTQGWGDVTLSTEDDIASDVRTAIRNYGDIKDAVESNNRDSRVYVVEIEAADLWDARTVVEHIYCAVQDLEGGVEPIWPSKPEEVDG